MTDPHVRGESVKHLEPPPFAKAELPEEVRDTLVRNADIARIISFLLEPVRALIVGETPVKEYEALLEQIAKLISRNNAKYRGSL